MFLSQRILVIRLKSKRLSVLITQYCWQSETTDLLRFLYTHDQSIGSDLNFFFRQSQYELVNMVEIPPNVHGFVSYFDNIRSPKKITHVHLISLLAVANDHGVL